MLSDDDRANVIDGFAWGNNATAEIASALALATAINDAAVEILNNAAARSAIAFFAERAPTARELASDVRVALAKEDPSAAVANTIAAAIDRAKAARDGARAAWMLADGTKFATPKRAVNELARDKFSRVFWSDMAKFAK